MDVQRAACSIIINTYLLVYARRVHTTNIYETTQVYEKLLGDLTVALSRILKPIRALTVACGIQLGCVCVCQMAN